MSKKTVLFLCTNNSVRSQIAEAFVNNLYPKKYEAYSAGTKPTQINPFTKKVMQEVNIDITHNRAKSINELHKKTEGYKVMICLETMAGQGTNIGRYFKDIAEIIKLIEDESRIGVCFDTCHSFAAGYDLKTDKGYEKTWEFPNLARKGTDALRPARSHGIPARRDSEPAAGPPPGNSSGFFPEQKARYKRCSRNRSRLGS